MHCTDGHAHTRPYFFLEPKPWALPSENGHRTTMEQSWNLEKRESSCREKRVVCVASDADECNYRSIRLLRVNTLYDRSENYKDGSVSTQRDNHLHPITMQSNPSHRHTMPDDSLTLPVPTETGQAPTTSSFKETVDPRDRQMLERALRRTA